MPKVLVVDDDQVSLEFVEMVLEPLHIDLDCVKDTHEAVRLLHQHAYQLIITDIIMEHSGINFIQHIKKQNWEIPIIAVTGSLIAASALKEDERVSDIFIKPYNKNDLLFKVKNLVFEN